MLTNKKRFLIVFCREFLPIEIRERILHENFGGLQEKVQELELSFSPQKERDLCSKLKIDLVHYFDERYPSLLREISDPPLILYMKGDYRDDDRYAVAVVGTRHPNFYGQTQARKISSELAQSGLTIVSGMARGIDQCSHQGALTIPYGRTIAVLGCGLDVDYPKASSKLKEKIIEQGVMMSEYGLGTQPLSRNFPQRNRIIAGLSLATLVIQAA